MDQVLLFGVIGIGAGWLFLITWFVYRSTRHYRKLTAGSDKTSLSDIVVDALDRVKKNQKEIEGLKKELSAFQSMVVHHVQKVGLVRFNPFADTGGGQSFVLAILDGMDTGVVLTSLHHRGSTRWYAKRVKNGKGVDFDLSNEEKEAIRKSSPLA